MFAEWLAIGHDTFVSQEYHSNAPMPTARENAPRRLRVIVTRPGPPIGRTILIVGATIEGVGRRRRLGCLARAALSLRDRRRCRRGSSRGRSVLVDIVTTIPPVVVWRTILIVSAAIEWIRIEA